nr:hypothetical protein [Tanacetum cinerariifolium]
MCEMLCQIVQKKLEEKHIEEEQVAKAQNSKIPVCYDDDDDEERSNSLQDNIIFELPPRSAITPNEPVNSLSMGDEHLNTISATESDEFIKCCIKNLVPNPSESEGENGCDVPACFTTFSDILFDVEYEFDSNPHHFDAESDLIESMLNHDSSIISSSSKIDSFLDEFAGELILLKSIPPRINESDCYHENDIRLIERFLNDNSSPRPPKEFVSENSDANIESFSPSPIPDEDSNSRMEEVDLTFTLDDPIPPSIENDDNDSERDILILQELPSNYSLSLPEIPIPGLTITRVQNQEKSPDLLSHRGLENFQLSAKRSMMIHGKNILDILLFHFYPLDQLKYGGNWVKLSHLKQVLRGRHLMLISS